MRYSYRLHPETEKDFIETYTAGKRIFLQIDGKLTEKKMKEVINKIYEFL